MTREIRITIDDDEVFERMKRTKQELDLSWREVLHRGLQLYDPSHHASEMQPESETRGYSDSRVENEIGDRIERHVKERIETSLENALGIETHGRDSPGHAPYGYEEDVESLENAEDAILSVPFLEDTPAYKVPLRVELEMRAGGVDVNVVTVRQGKSVEEMNTFDRGARRRIAEALATGSEVRLELGDGEEEYRVTPVLTWSRDSQGEPVVDDVEIEDVLFGE